MTGEPKKSSRNVRNFKPRTPGGALGALLGAGAMSVIAGVLVTAAVTPVVALTAAATSTTINIFESLPDHIDPSQLSQPSTIWAKKDGEEVLLARFYAQNREMVGWDDISQYAKDAAVSEEDPRFYSHGGIDVLAAGRAAVQHAAGTGRSGASTITMQYVRNMLVQEAEMIPDEAERAEAYQNATRSDMDRKLKEMRLAISVEKSYSKNDILLGYLNIANFGGQVYGIQSAAKTYYSKDAKDLTIAEAASLVGIVNSPSVLSLSNPDNIPANQARRDKIIGSMLREGKITQAQHDEAIATPVEPKLSPTPSGCTMADAYAGAGHFCDYVVRTLQNDPAFGDTPEKRWFRFQNGGLKIITTLDMDMQQAAFDATRANAPAQVPGMDYGNASVSVENRTGRVLSMVQNRPFHDNQEFVQANPEYTSINYNTDYEYGGSSGFQYGSVVKAFTVAEWLRTGHSLNDRVFLGARTVNTSNFTGSCFPGGVYGYETWTFRNDYNRGNGQNGTVLRALDESLNGGFVSMIERMDMCGVFKLAEDMGVKRAIKSSNAEAPNYDTRNLAIVPSGVYNGNDEVSPITLASAYAGFASEGIVCTPIPIDAITGPEGEAVEFTDSDCRQAIQPEVANGTGYALEHYVTNGLGRAALSKIGIPHMGKTGTTDNIKDDWWVGGSSKVTTAVWNGNVTGGVNLMSVGLYRNTGVIWPAIMDVADRKYGGDPFKDVDPAALRTQQVAVPDVTGRTVEEATKLLEDAGFSVTEGDEIDSTETKGRVASTDPEAGSQVPAGSTITLNISNGNAPEEAAESEDSTGDLTVPGGLTGETAQAAANRLGAAGFTSIYMQCETNAEPSASNTVKTVSPASGRTANADDRITLTLSC